MKRRIDIERGFIDLGNEIKILVKYIVPGTRLLYNTYDELGNIVHPAKVPFSLEKITELLNGQVESIFYSKPVVDNRFQYFNNTLEEYLESKTYQGPRSISVETQKVAVRAMENIIKALKEKDQMELDQARIVIEKLLHDIDNRDEEIINLIAIQDYDDITYTHSLNVGIISILLAKDIGFDTQTIKDIGLGGFLHDLGKIKIPYQILNKSTPLTADEYNIIKKHPVYGYELLKKDPKVNDTVKEMVLMHHEKYDGSGYPIGCKGNQISEGANIIAIAEAYDMLTTEHPYKKAVSPKEAFAIIIKDGGTHFKSDICRLFVNHLKKILLKEDQYFQVGNYVLLNTHEVALVKEKDSEMTSRPKIEIVVNHLGKILTKPVSVDLVVDGSRNIEKILDKNAFEGIFA